MAASNIIYDASVYLFEIPQLKAGHRHKASQWNLTNYINAKLQLLSGKYSSCCIKILVSAGDRRPWATCQVYAYPGPSINPVVDSNRYFTSKVTWNNGKTEVVGICFESRHDSKEFISSLTNYLIYGLKPDGRHEGENNVSSSTFSVSQMSDILEELKSSSSASTLSTSRISDIQNEQNSSSTTPTRDIPGTPVKASPEISKEIEKIETLFVPGSEKSPPPAEPRVFVNDLTFSQLVERAGEALSKLGINDENQKTTPTTTACDTVTKTKVVKTESFGFINRVQSSDKTVIRQLATTKDQLEQLYEEIWQRAPKQLMRPLGKASTNIGAR